MKDLSRLDRLVARNLGLSRRHAEGLLASGRLTDVEGRAFPDARASIAPGQLPLGARLDGEPASLFHEAHVLLHKPAGCVTALVDPQHPTAYELVKTAPLFSELRPVGRLDKDTTGLLLFTTDGQLLHRLIAPRTRLARTYQAALARVFSAPAAGFTLEDGHVPDISAIETITASELHPALRHSPEATVFARITIVGGAYHEVRRIFAALGSHVVELCRVQFGGIALPAELPAGEFVLLDQVPG